MVICQTLSTHERVFQSRSHLNSYITHQKKYEYKGFMHDLSIAVLGKTSVFLYGCRTPSFKIASKPEVYFMQQQNERDFKNYCPEKNSYLQQTEKNRQQ